MADVKVPEMMTIICGSVAVFMSLMLALCLRAPGGRSGERRCWGWFCAPHPRDPEKEKEWDCCALLPNVVIFLSLGIAIGAPTELPLKGVGIITLLVTFLLIVVQLLKKASCKMPYTTVAAIVGTVDNTIVENTIDENVEDIALLQMQAGDGGNAV